MLLSCYQCKASRRSCSYNAPHLGLHAPLRMHRPPVAGPPTPKSTAAPVTLYHGAHLQGLIQTISRGRSLHCVSIPAPSPPVPLHRPCPTARHAQPTQDSYCTLYLSRTSMPLAHHQHHATGISLAMGALRCGIAPRARTCLSSYRQTQEVHTRHASAPQLHQDQSPSNTGTAFVENCQYATAPTNTGSCHPPLPPALLSLCAQVYCKPATHATHASLGRCMCQDAACCSKSLPLPRVAHALQTQ